MSKHHSRRPAHRPARDRNQPSAPTYWSRVVVPGAGSFEVELRLPTQADLRERTEDAQRLKKLFRAEGAPPEELSNQSVAIIAKIVVNWSGVFDDSGRVVPCNAQTLRTMIVDQSLLPNFLNAIQKSLPKALGVRGLPQHG